MVGYRAVNALVCLLGVGGLGLARWLEPSPVGHSTHTQLGLPGCSFLELTQVPCPMCGGTTTWSMMAHGRWWEGLWNQPFAAALFVVAVLVIGVSGAEACQPRRRWARIEDAVRPVEPYLAVGILGAMLLSWIWKITTFS